MGSRGGTVTHCMYKDIMINYYGLCFTCLISSEIRGFGMTKQLSQHKCFPFIVRGRKLITPFISDRLLLLVGKNLHASFFLSPLCGGISALRPNFHIFPADPLKVWGLAPDNLAKLVICRAAFNGIMRCRCQGEKPETAIRERARHLRRQAAQYLPDTFN